MSQLQMKIGSDLFCQSYSSKKLLAAAEMQSLLDLHSEILKYLRALVSFEVQNCLFILKTPNHRVCNSFSASVLVYGSFVGLKLICTFTRPLPPKKNGPQLLFLQDFLALTLKEYLCLSFFSICAICNLENLDLYFKKFLVQPNCPMAL